MSETAPTSGIAPVGVVDPTTAQLEAIYALDTVPHPFGDFRDRVDTPPVGVQTPAEAPVGSALATVDTAPALQPEAATTAEVPPTAQHLGAIATEAVTGAAAKGGSKADKALKAATQAAKAAKQAAKAAKQTQKTVTQLTGGGKPPKKKKGKGVGAPQPYNPVDYYADWRQTYGYDEYAKAPGYIDSTDRPRALIPVNPPNAGVKGVPRFGASGPSRAEHWDWGTRPWPYWQEAGYNLKKQFTSLLPGGWFDRRGRRNRLVDPLNDIDPVTGRLNERNLGVRSVRQPWNVRRLYATTRPIKTGPKQRHYLYR